MYVLLENEDPNYQFIVQEWHSGIHFFFLIFLFLTCFHIIFGLISHYH